MNTILEKEVQSNAKKSKIKPGTGRRVLALVLVGVTILGFVATAVAYMI